MNETSQADRFAPLFAELDRRLAGEALVRLAIEGGSASGKTTLGKILAERYDCTVFHMDDFFLRAEQRTAARFARARRECGSGTVSRRGSAPAPARRKGFLPAVRLRFHVAAKCRGDRAEKVRCCRGGILHAPRPCAVLRSFRISGHLPGIAARRISRRNTPEKANRFFAEWIPMEQAYFAAFDIPAKCTLRLPIL